MENNKISLCMIAKDEELVIQRALICAKQFVDEIILVDTGSTDRTKEFAQLIGANIYDFQWCNDFSKARNFAFSKATKNYIFWMDADDYITPENIEIIHKIKGELNNNEIDVVSMVYSLGLDSHGNTISSLRRNRIVRRDKNYKWIGKIHEYLEVDGNTINSEAIIYHGKVKENTDRNLQYFNMMKADNEKFSLRDILYYGNELFQYGLYEEAIEQYNIFLESKKGWIEDIKTATSNLVECYKKLNMKQKAKECILKSFESDVPRADICCKLAECFMEDEDYKKAIFWYKVARECIHEKDNLGFNLKEYYTWIPTIQLCLCYSLLGDYETAYYYNEITALYTPKSENVDNNRIYLKDKLNELNKNVPQFSIELLRRV